MFGGGQIREGVSGPYRIHLHECVAMEPPSFLPPSSLSGATADRHMLDIHERRADAYIHKHPRPPRGGDVDGVGHNVRIRTAASLFPLSRRGSCRATPFFAYASPSRHLRRVVRVQSEERFLNLERRRRDRSPMRRGDHQRDQKRMQRADGRRRRRFPKTHATSAE